MAGNTRLALALRGDLSKIMKAEINVGEAAAFAGVDAATQGCKGELRAQVTGAGLGKRLANTWRSQTYPADRRSLKPGGFIWSKAPAIITAFASGATIRAQSGGYLAIPLPAAGKKGDGGTRITPGGWERAHGQRLRFVYRRGQASLLVADNARLARSGRAIARKGKGRARVTIPIFVLVPQVTLKKRLDVEAAAHKWGAKIPELVGGAWKTPTVRLG